MKEGQTNNIQNAFWEYINDNYSPENLAKSAAKDIAKDFLNDKLEEYGYGKEQKEAMIAIITGGNSYGLDLNASLGITKDSEVAKRIGDSIEVFGKIDNLNSFYNDYIKPISDIYSSLTIAASDLQKNGNKYSYEGSEALEKSLDSFLDLTNNLMKKTDYYLANISDPLLSEFKEIIHDGIKHMEDAGLGTALFKLGTDLEVAGIKGNFGQKVADLRRQDNWKDGPTIKELEEIYKFCNDNNIDSSILDGYTKWRTNYEISQVIEEEAKKNHMTTEQYIKQIENEAKKFRNLANSSKEKKSFWDKLTDNWWWNHWENVGSEIYQKIHKKNDNDASDTSFAVASVKPSMAAAKMSGSDNMEILSSSIGMTGTIKYLWSVSQIRDVIEQLKKCENNLQTLRDKYAQLPDKVNEAWKSANADELNEIIETDIDTYDMLLEGIEVLREALGKAAQAYEDGESNMISALDKLAADNNLYD